MGNSIEGPKEEPKKDVSKTWNILITPLFSYDNSEIIKKDTFHKHILSKRSVIINLIKGPNSNPKADAEFIVSLYRLRINALSAKGDFADIQETVEDYNSWMKYIIRAGEFDRAFDIFTVSKEDIEQLRKVLEEITTSIKSAEPAIAAVRHGIKGLFVGALLSLRQVIEISTRLGITAIEFQFIRPGNMALNGKLRHLERYYRKSLFGKRKGLLEKIRSLFGKKRYKRAS